MNHEERRERPRREDDEWKTNIEDRVINMEKTMETTAKFMRGLDALNTLGAWAINVVKFMAPVVAILLGLLTWWNSKKP